MRSFGYLALRFVWRKLTPSFVKRGLLPIIHATYHAAVMRRTARDIANKEPLLMKLNYRPGPLVVSGFFGEALGIGRAGHCTFEALAQNGYAPLAHAIRPLLNGYGPNTLTLPGDTSGGIYVMHCNAPEAATVLSVLSVGCLKHKYRIGYWAYELPSAPDSWIEVSQFFHELWVPSEFVKQSLAAAHCPVRVMPHPVLATLPPVKPDREALGLPPDRFLVLVAGDLRSSSYRKNLMGAIDLYLTAFPKPSQDYGLVLKISFIHEDKASFQRVMKKIEARSDISLITEHLPYETMQQIVASCDVFLSPHRSEGFGLVLAEALALGVPVLATGWSGNLDFMQGMDEALIPYTLQGVQDPSGVYASRLDQVWAEPNMDAGAAMLLRLYRDPALRKRLAEQGRRNVEKLSEPWATANLFPVGKPLPPPPHTPVNELAH